MNDKPKSTKGVYHSPLSKLFARQQPKVKAKKGMARLLMAYAEGDTQRIACLIKTWLAADD